MLEVVCGNETSSCTFVGESKARWRSGPRLWRLLLLPLLLVEHLPPVSPAMLLSRPVTNWLTLDLQSVCALLETSVSRWCSMSLRTSTVPACGLRLLLWQRCLQRLGSLLLLPTQTRSAS